jgi:hypothetical protein
LLSVTLTCIDLDSTAEGVPLITPLETFKERPEGSDPETRENDLEFEPPEVAIAKE